MFVPAGFDISCGKFCQIYALTSGYYSQLQLLDCYIEDYGWSNGGRLRLQVDFKKSFRFLNILVVSFSVCLFGFLLLFIPTHIHVRIPLFRKQRYLEADMSIWCYVWQLLYFVSYMLLLVLFKINYSYTIVKTVV